MPTYESVLILRQDLPMAKAQEVGADFVKVATQLGAQLLKTEYWGLIDLNYVIKKNKKGHYMMFVLDAPSDAMSEFHRKLKISEDVINSLTTRIEQCDLKPSPMMLKAQISSRETSRHDSSTNQAYSNEIS